MIIKSLFIDVETSGTNNYRNGIWQVAAKLYENDQFVDSIEIICDIFPSQEWNSIAWDMCPIEDFSEYDSAQIGFKNFKDFLSSHVDPFDKRDKMFFYAYNAPFDERFIRSFFYNNNDKFFGSWFWTPSIDVMRLAAEKMRTDIPNMENFKQGTVAKELGIEVDDEKLHDAMYDIEISKQVYDRVV